MFRLSVNALTVCVLLIYGLLLLTTSVKCDVDHSHSHDEPPAFKYSKAANEELPHEHHSHSTSTTPTGNPNVWLTAISSTVLISLAPILILFCVPAVDTTGKHQNLLNILLAFASGGLLGDAFLHLIPHANLGASHHSHSHNNAHVVDRHQPVPVGLWVLCGIVTFLIVEKTVVLFKANGGGAHGHSHKTTKGKEKPTTPAEADIKVSGYLNLAADFCHNLTDGLAIGAAYMTSTTVGVVTTVTILLHEVPHEIGDFAILLQSGVSRRMAVLLQSVTAVGAIFGTILSFLIQGGDDEGSAPAQWIQPFTAGGFIYIALVSVMPELLNERHPTVRGTICQVFALLTGIGLMVIIEYFE